MQPGSDPLVESLIDPSKRAPASLWSFGSTVIGHGGVHGSAVYEMKLAYKKARLNNSELMLISELQKRPPLPGLITPLLITYDEQQHPVGIVMPRLTCSLQEVMASRCRTCPVVPDLPEGIRTDLLLTEIRFRPILSLKVLGCVTYQLLVALCNLKYALPHSFNGQSFIGFSHNDLRLDNILVDSETGQLVLCDYEQVGHYTADHCIKEFDMKSRMLSPVYFPPQGKGSKKCEEWCLGLVVLELYTGVQPLMNSGALSDDFTYGDEALKEGFDWSRTVGPEDYRQHFPPLATFVQELRAATYPDGDGGDAELSLAFSDFLALTLNRSTESRGELLQLLEHRWIRLSLGLVVDSEKASPCVDCGKTDSGPSFPASVQNTRPVALATVKAWLKLGQ